MSGWLVSASARPSQLSALCTRKPRHSGKLSRMALCLEHSLYPGLDPPLRRLRHYFGPLCGRYSYNCIDIFKRTQCAL
jgi:hypothetical protein